jgi:DNA (cytosine-5)-methyltransferase 1
MKKKFKFIDLFCGIGGFRLSFDELGGECVFSSDIDKYAGQTYEANFGEFPQGDITKIEAEQIPSFDILLGGFPCQPFSYSGQKEGFEDKTRGTLFFDIVRIIKHHKPKMFLLENVKGLKSHNNGETLNIIEETLRELGYHIHWKVLDSLNFGVPQKRERWYCVGFNKNVNFDFPSGKRDQPKLKDIIIQSDNDDKSLWLTKFEIERIEKHFKSNEIRVKHDNSKYAPNTKKGKYGIYSFQKSDGSLRFHVGDVAKTQIQEAFYSCVNTYACTIIANRTPKLWDLRRKLSVREAARLQGFPDEFVFPVSNNQAYKQLGNSVVVPVIKAIGSEMLKSYWSGSIKLDLFSNSDVIIPVNSSKRKAVKDKSYI